MILTIRLWLKYLVVGIHLFAVICIGTVQGQGPPETIAHNLDPTARSFYRLGTQYQSGGILDSAAYYIEKAIHIAPQVPELQIALAKIHYLKGTLLQLEEIGNPANSEIPCFERASRHVRLAIDIAPDNIDALILAAQIHLEYNEPEDRKHAGQFLEQAIAIAPGNPDAAIVYLEYLQRTGSVLKASRKALELNKSFPNRIDVQLQSAKIELLVAPNAGACEQYLTALEKPLSPAALYAELKDVYFFLSMQEQADLNKLDPELRGSFLTTFWRSKNPKPYSLMNRRLIEHLERVYTSRTRYAKRHPPGYDDRGKIYIRYGHPHSHVEDPGSNAVYPNQSWVYHYPFGNLTFDFIRFETEFILSNSLVGAGRYSDVPIRQLYRDREHIDDAYQTMSKHYSGGQIKKHAYDQYIIMKKAPLSFYRLPFGQSSFPIWSSAAGYLNTDGTSRIEINYAMPTRSLPFSTSLFGSGKCMLKSQILVTDSKNQSVYYDNDFLTIWLSPFDPARTGYSLNSQTVSLPPGDYIINMGLQSVDRKKMGATRNSVSIPNYASGQLQLSGLQYGIRIEPPQYTDPEQPLLGHKVYAYPLPYLIQSTPMYAYCEVYNLQKNSQELAKYQAHFEIMPLENRSSFQLFFSNLLQNDLPAPASIISINNQTDQSKDFLYAFLDLPAVELGWNFLNVTVQDEVSGDSFQMSRLFELITANEFQKRLAPKRPEPQYIQRNTSQRRPEGRRRRR